MSVRCTYAVRRPQSTNPILDSPAAAEAFTVSMVQRVTSVSTPCTSAILPSMATTLPFSAIYESSPPSSTCAALSANMARKVAYWRPDAGTNSTPRERNRASIGQKPCGISLCSSSRVPSISATTKRMSCGISMLVQSAALTGVLSMFSLEYQIFQRLCDMWNQLLFRMLVATI